MTREEMLAVAKPILFNTEMVCKVLDGTKSATRRVVKPQPFAVKQDENAPCWCGHFVSESGKVLPDKPPYRPGDILYVRETWALVHDETGNAPVRWRYKADDETSPIERWYPSIHMPKEAARIFLRVTGAKVCRLQDITEEQAKAEGAVKAYPYIDPSTHETEYMESEYGDYLAGFECLWNSCYAAPRGVKDGHGVITNYESFPFEEIRETRTYKGKPWCVIGNPWVWGYEFEIVEEKK